MAILTSYKRGYGTSKYALDLGKTGTNGGWINDVEGGHATGEVITEKIGSDHLQKKHIGNVKFEDISFTCGTGMSHAIYDWIYTGFNQTFNVSNAGRSDGAIVMGDYDFKETGRLEYHFAILTEFGMPALDAASKDAAKMKLKFAIESSKFLPGTGKDMRTLTAGQQAKQKQWTPAFFRLSIDDGNLKDGCSKVNKIDALTLKQKVTDHAVGEMRTYQKEAVGVEVPNLVITLAESHAQGFYDWHHQMVIDGKCGEENEKTGTLEYLAADTTTVLVRCHFAHLGIFKVTPDKVEAGGEGVRRVKAEMYCEEMKVEFTSACWV